MKGFTIRPIPAFFILIITLLLFYALVFTCIRLVFVFFNLPISIHVSYVDYLKAFVMGVRFDLLVSSFVLLLPAVLIYLDQLFRLRSRLIIVIIQAILLSVGILVLFIGSADIPYFSQFGSHINKSVMVWRMSPIYALKLIFSSFYYWGFVLLFIGFVILYLLFLRSVFKRYKLELQTSNQNNRLKNSMYFLILAFLLFTLARGRLSSKSTMHEGMAIVSQNTFINQIALNANFTLLKSLNKKSSNTDYLKHIDIDLKRCSSFFKNNYFPDKGVLNRELVNTNHKDSLLPYNVIVVLMESLNMSKLGYHKHKNLSPYLNQLAAESVFFDRFFSSGIHTFNGLFSTVSGFPSIYTEQGLRQYTKRPFTTLAGLLKPYGYHTYFCTTHDPVFDNMEGFFKLNGYDKVISESDFSMTESMGVTGVPDHLLYKKLIETINTNEQSLPFVAYVMTGTDHGPWHIPQHISFKPKGNSYQENASMYADWSVQEFMEEAKKQSWYKQTVFVFLGDHGQIMNDPYDMPITYHHTPLIIHCPSLLSPEVNHNLGYQPDVVKTLSSVLNVKYDNFSFGENILITKRPIVFFSADDKLGYVTDDDYFFYHCFADDQKKFVKYQNLEPQNYYQENKSRADSLYALTKSLYNSAQYYIQQNYSAN